MSVPDLQTTHQTLKTDNANLVNALREKNRKHAQTQELYDRLKRKEMAAVTRSAALDSADETVLQSALVRNGSGGNRHGRQGSGGGPLGRGRPSPLGRFPNGGGFTGERGSAGGSPRKVQQNFIAGIGGGREMGPPPVPRQGGGGGFIGPQGSLMSRLPFSSTPVFRWQLLTYIQQAIAHHYRLTTARGSAAA